MPSRPRSKKLSTESVSAGVGRSVPDWSMMRTVPFWVQQKSRPSGANSIWVPLIPAAPPKVPPHGWSMNPAGTVASSRRDSSFSARNETAVLAIERVARMHFLLGNDDSRGSLAES
jgi:hypothetical protein